MKELINTCAWCGRQVPENVVVVDFQKRGEGQAAEKEKHQDNPGRPLPTPFPGRGGVTRFVHEAPFENTACRSILATASLYAGMHHGFNKAGAIARAKALLTAAREFVNQKFYR